MTSEAPQTAEQERAAVVAWLIEADDEGLDEAILTEAIKQHRQGLFSSFPFAKIIADAIEQGQHIKETSRG